MCRGGGPLVKSRGARRLLVCWRANFRRVTAVLPPRSSHTMMPFVHQCRRQRRDADESQFVRAASSPKRNEPDDESAVRLPLPGDFFLRCCWHVGLASLWWPSQRDDGELVPAPRLVGTASRAGG